MDNNVCDVKSILLGAEHKLFVCFFAPFYILGTWIAVSFIYNYVNITNKINLILLKRIGAPVIIKSFDKNKIEEFFKRELFN